MFITNFKLSYKTKGFIIFKLCSRLQILVDGRMKHLIHHKHSTDSIKEEFIPNHSFSLHDPVIIPETKEPAYFSHERDKYCMDKVSC